MVLVTKGVGSGHGHDLDGLRSIQWSMSMDDFEVSKMGL